MTRFSCPHCGRPLELELPTKTESVSKPRVSDAARGAVSSLARKLQRKTGLAFVPDVVAELQRRGVQDPKGAILSAAEQEEIELRPEGGVNRLTPAELAACIPGPHGTVLSWARPLRRS